MHTPAFAWFRCVSSQTDRDGSWVASWTRSIESPFFKPVAAASAVSGRVSDPAAADVRAFLATHGIGYIYADAAHPNSLVPDAIPVFSADGLTIYRIE